MKPRVGVAQRDFDAFHKSHGTRMLRRWANLDGVQLVGLPGGAKASEVIAWMNRSGLCEYAEPDYYVHASLTPNDPRFADGSLWGLHNSGNSGGTSDADIDAPEAWDTLNSADGILVAVVDSGVRYTHEDLAANMWVNPLEIPGNGRDDDGNGLIDDIHGINAVANSGDPVDDHGHGTHVAGIIGAVGNNNKGVTGVAWRVQIMACKFMDSTGEGTISDAVQCLDYARLHGANIINASWGGPDYSRTLQSAIAKARQAGVILVTAAGNDGANIDATPSYPASFDLDNIVSVAATTRTDQLADYSNFGIRAVDLTAPGSSVYSTYFGSDSSYTYLSGTSMAAPHVSGALALLRARYPTDGYLSLVNRLLGATDPLAVLADKCATGGRLNLETALGAKLVADFAATPTTGSAPLTVTFTDTSVGPPVSWDWDFGDGSAHSSLQHPTHLFAQVGDFTVTLTVTDAEGTTRSKSQGISAISNYQIQAKAFSWINPSTMTRLTLADNGVSAALDLPFAFQFYGQECRQIHVGANGLVGFTSQGLKASSNRDLPDATSPNEIICPYWDDLNPGSSGQVYYGVTGVAPQRLAVVSWVAVPLRARPTTPLSFQVALQEGSNEILFQYLDVRPSSRNGGGKSATVGIENGSGEVAAKYSSNGSTLLNNEQAILFVPPASAQLAVGPESDLTATGARGGPFSPTSQLYTLENLGNAPLTWTAANTQSWTALSATTGTLAPGEQVGVTVSINDEAASLPSGTHVDTISFLNTTDGKGNTQRAVHLTVNGATGLLVVTPENGLASAGTVGGPFSPATQVYTLINDGDAALEWRATATEAWIGAAPTEGELGPGGSTTVTVKLTDLAGSLPAGDFTSAVTFENRTNGEGNTERLVNLSVTASAPGLSVIGPSEPIASGFAGGPFTPGTFEFVLTNSGTDALEWTGTSDQDWLSLSITNGVLASGETTQVVALIATSANGLPQGEYTGLITFLNSTSTEAPKVFALALRVWPPAELSAPTVSAVGPITFELSGEPGLTFAIEASSDLQQWLPVLTNTVSADGTLLFTEPDAANLTQRFYRAVQQ